MIKDFLNIVIPMAGRGSRFEQAGYETPKPLIPVLGVPMIELVVRNLTPSRPHRFIFVIRKDLRVDHAIDGLLGEIAPGCLIHELDHVTDGAACTVLTVRDAIDTQNPLMLANCDQWIDVGIDDYLLAMDQGCADGMIMTMTASDPKWSFVRLDERGRPVEVVEKQVVSNEATVGIYNFRHGSDFVAAADRMIAKNLRVNNEFYVAPVYNELLATGKRLLLYNVGTEGNGMCGLGTPEDVTHFVQKEAPRRVR